MYVDYSIPARLCSRLGSRDSSLCGDDRMMSGIDAADLDAAINVAQAVSAAAQRSPFKQGRPPAPPIPAALQTRGSHSIESEPCWHHSARCRHARWYILRWSQAPSPLGQLLNNVLSCAIMSRNNVKEHYLTGATSIQLDLLLISFRCHRICR